MINVTKTFLPNISLYQSYVEKIFANGWLTNNGDLVKQLQKELSEYLGVENLLLVSNGTLALQVAYKVLNLRGSVITTPFSFVATTSSILWEGLQPVFADIDPHTFTIDPFEVEKTITKDTSAVVATHVYGNACDVERLDYLARSRGIHIVYDAAHAFGTRYDDQSLLNFGDVSILSFHSTKIFHTIEGGALVFKSRELYEKASKMINFGIESPEKISQLGINCKMNEFQAAMGLCVLKEMDYISRARKTRYDLYFNRLSLCPALQIPERSQKVTNNYSHFPIVFPDEATLLEVIDRLRDIQVIPRRYFYPSLNQLPYIQESCSMPISEHISRLVLCLPLFHDLEERNQMEIIEIVENILQKKGYGERDRQ